MVQNWAGSQWRVSLCQTWPWSFSQTADQLGFSQHPIAWVYDLLFLLVMVWEKGKHELAVAGQRKRVSD